MRGTIAPPLTAPPKEIALIKWLIAIVSTARQTVALPSARVHRRIFSRLCALLVVLVLPLITSLAMYKPVKAGTFDIGIIPETESCPTGSELIRIFMDDEDTRNRNSRSGWIGATISNRNTTFIFCRVDGSAFTSMPGAYVVLLLSGQCPAGASPFTRRFDNQDGSNTNEVWTSMGGGIYPSTSDSNYTTLVFCSMPATAGSTGTFPDLGISYGVFAAGDFPSALATGWFHTDDEDDSNDNYFSYSYGGQQFLTDLIIEYNGWRNTTLRTAKVR